MAQLNPNAVTGLGSKLNTQEIIERFINIEKRRVKPVEQRKEQKLGELEAWNAVKMELQKLQSVTDLLNRSDVWEARRVETSHPEIVEAKARRDAEPGKTTMAVDSIALSHQITSQGFERDDVRIGTGKVRIKVGDDEDDTPVTINLTEGKDTLKDLKQAINDSDADVEAYIAKTHGDKPYRLLLTSNVSGEKGRITIEVNLEGGEVEAPDYENYFDQTAEWKGLDPEEPETVSREGVGSSTPITGVIGTFTGEEDTTFTFTVIRAGVIPSDEGIVIGWKDNKGRAGELEVNKFNYVPGTGLDIVDGLQLVLSDGEAVDGDFFTVNAFARKSDMLWWLSEAERAPRVTQPSDWSSKATTGGIKVTGKYEGAEDQTVVFRVEGSGQVGGPKPLKLHYEFTETGERGTVNIGHPYLGDKSEKDGGIDSATAFDSKDGEELFELQFNQQGHDPKKLPIANGLFIEIQPSVLRDGDTAEIDLIAPTSEDMWWLDEEIRGVSPIIDKVAKWRPYEEVIVEEGGDAAASKLDVRDGILGIEANKSNALIQVSGRYKGEDTKTYTFTVQKRGNVGVTRVLMVNWEDTFGNTGKLEFGQGYVPGTPIYFDEGLSLALGEGELYKNDSFNIETQTTTVRKAQDLVVRLGATKYGGGLEVRRPENKANDIVQGLDLEFFSSSEDPVTISVIGDTEKAKEKVLDFVDAYNTFSATAKEVAKFDKATNTAAPLLSDRNLAQMVNEIATTTIGTVKGLPQSDNMLFSIGLRLNDKGVMLIEEKKLDEKIEEDFAAVANLFRGHGKSDAPGVTFVGMTGQTKISAEGYKIDLSKSAERGTYLGAPIPPVITINETNNLLSIISNGRSSDPIELRQDTYSVGSLAKAIQTRLAEDKVLGKRGIQVRAEDNRLKIISGTYGKSSVIEVEPGQGKDLSSLGLVEGKSTPGEDVVGTIDNLPAKGRGQLLVGEKDTSAEGLRVFVTLDDAELEPDKEEARVVITKGIAVKLGDKLKRINDPVNGNVKKVTGDLTDQMRSYDEQINRLNERIETKRGHLQNKFAKLDNTMGRLRSQQNYISQQLAALSGGAQFGKNKDK